MSQIRSAEAIKQLILGKANTDNRIRAVLLNGSRANDNIKPDRYQDFDLVFIVNELETFTADHSWTDCFGEIALWQLPGEMTLDDESHPDSFTYLMVFSDWHRIDLTLFPKNKLAESFEYDSLTKVWLDKDNLFNDIPRAGDSDYLIRKPSEKEFLDICNEFWWVSPYVAKAIMREEIIHAKEIMDIPVRKMFNRLIEIYVGVETNFSVSAGKGLKFIQKYIQTSEYEKILQTYPNQKSGEIIRGQKMMMDLFSRFAKTIAHSLNYPYNLKEESNAINYFDAMLDQEPGESK
ncbi:MAG: aminoglycoside 6-adenylyltransferase [Bacteroidota bacterium]